VTVFLSAEQVLFIHDRLIAETGGEHGLRDVGLLISAIGRPMTTFEGIELYPMLSDKAAALMHSLIFNHPFIDGNKRTAITAAAMFLLRNGYRLTVDYTELERFTLLVVNDRLTVVDISAWFQANIASIG
jgi:death-on-curing protein